MFSDQDEKTARDYLELYCPKPSGGIHGVVGEAEAETDLCVIVPCYNQSAYLKDCLDPVLNYRFRRKVSFIFVDDGSTDGSGEILDSYAERTGVSVIHQENHGLSHARNTALKRCSSSYIFLLDADDVVVPSVLERILDFAIDQGADVVECAYETFQTGSELKTSEQTPEQKEIRSLPWNKLRGYAWGKVFREELFREICFPEGYLMEDCVMGFLFAPRCREVYLCGECGYFYRMNPAGITAGIQKEKRAVHTYWVLELMLDNMDRLQIPMDNMLYDKVLNWIVMNYVIIRYQDQNAQVAIFILLCRRLKAWNQSFSSENRGYHLVQQALAAEDYALYQKSCELAWQADQGR